MLAVLVLRLAQPDSSAGGAAPAPDETYVRFRDAVEQHFAHTRRVEDYARLADQLTFPSPTHFSKFFHHRTGRTPIAFRTAVGGRGESGSARAGGYALCFPARPVCIHPRGVPVVSGCVFPEGGRVPGTVRS